MLLEYEEVELSNNLAENSIRPVALGRKNWLHVGSIKAGPKVAEYSRWWKRAGGCRYRKISDISGLTPARWSAARH